MTRLTSWATERGAGQARGGKGLRQARGKGLGSKGYGHARGKGAYAYARDAIRCRHDVAAQLVTLGPLGGPAVLSKCPEVRGA